MAVDLESMTVAELDAFAASLGLTDYPASGSKSEKIAFLDPYRDAVQVPPPDVEAEAVEEESFTLELDSDYNGVQLQVGNEYVELTSANSSYETTDKPGYNAVRFVTGVKQADS